MKGYRTIIWNILQIVGGLTAVLIFFDWDSLGLEAREVAFIILGLKILDNLVNTYLRMITDTKVGRKQ